MLVDDDKTILNTLKPGLEEAGYIVFTAESGSTATAIYEKDSPDIGIIDFSLPDSTGAALIEKLSKIRYRPMLILSSHNDLDIVDNAIRTGACNYLVKPLSAKQLIPTIRLALTQFEQANVQLSSRYTNNRNTNITDEILDQLAFGTVVIDQQQNCINLNNIATELLQANDVLSLLNGKIRVNNPNTRSQFANYISALFNSNSSEYNPVFSIEKWMSGQWCHIYGTRLNTSQASLEYALLMIIDSSRDQPLTAEILKSLYGLTPKESALAEAINSGMRLEEYAEYNNIKITTVKTHLNAVFRKTGTNRQIDLVRLLSRLIDAVKF